MCLQSFIAESGEKLFALIKSEQNGEMTESDYNEKLNEIKEEELWSMIAPLGLDERKQLVEEFGTYNAIQNYNTHYDVSELVMGAVEIEFYGMLLHGIYMNDSHCILTTDFECYKLYCEYHN